MTTVEIDDRLAESAVREMLHPALDRMGRASVAEARRNTHVDTGQSRASVTYEVDRERLLMRFGSPLLKYRFQELGTLHMAAHAPLRRTLDELGPAYPRIAAGRG